MLNASECIVACSPARICHVSVNAVDPSICSRKCTSGMVYEDAEKLYAEVRKEGEKLLEEAFGALFPKSIPVSPSTQIPNKPGRLIAFNTTPFARRDVVKVPLGGNARIKNQVVQASKDVKTSYALMECESDGNGNLSVSTGLYADCMPVSGMLYSYRPRSTQIDVCAVFTNGSDHFVLRNSSVQLTITQGRITSLRDVALEFDYS